jgi:UDP-galactopyranose mutase
MTQSAVAAVPGDLVCFSHLRWDFLVQRPQHLLTRCARQRRVFYVEEPRFEADEHPVMRTGLRDGVCVLTPHVPQRLASGAALDTLVRRLLDDALMRHRVEIGLLWYYTPLALAVSRHLSAPAVVFDWMDERGGAAHESQNYRALERELLGRADIVFTDGRSLYEAKRACHRNVHAIPGSVEVAHFVGARDVAEETEGPIEMERPRLGYCGVLDERLDLDLLVAVAEARPEWQIVMIGPVVTTDPGALPRRRNIHYLGGKAYADLPRCIASWNVALIPFARNAATRFSSPTKTLEYLAAGKAVVSTSIRDVVRPYGLKGLVRIADEPAGFIAACEDAMAEDPLPRLARADALLKSLSWDRTWQRMSRLIEAARSPLPRVGDRRPGPALGRALPA